MSTNNNVKNYTTEKIEKKQWKNSKAVEDYKQKFKEKIEQIFWTRDKVTDFIDKVLKREIKNYILKSNFSFLKNYKKDNELDNDRINSKLEKYFPIHQNIFFKVINKQIEQLDEKSKNNINNIIKNSIEKYLYIIFIFSEKIKLSDLEKFLNMNLEDLSVRFANARNDIEILEKFEIEEQKSLKKIFSKNWKTSWEKFINESFISSMYRQNYREIVKSGWADRTWIWRKISVRMEKNYHQTINNIFYIFSTWIESDYQRNDERLENIEIIIKKLFDWLILLKKEWIAFAEFPIWKINSYFFKEINKIFLKDIQSKYKELFQFFITIVFEEDLKEKEKLYNKFFEQITKIEEETAKKRNPWKVEKQKIDITEVWFSTWEKTPEKQKYEIVFSKVLAKNGKMKFADFLYLKPGNKNFEEYFSIFTKYSIEKREIKWYEAEENFKKWLIKQIENILALEWVTVKEFIETDVNNLNFLILWWRFILKIRDLNKNFSDLNLKNILMINEKSYWVIEKISEKLNEKNILKWWKIIFDPDWRVKNTSVKWTNTLLMDLLKWLKKWFIDLNEESISTIYWEKKIIWKLRDLYLPIWIESEKNDLETEIWKIEKYINSWINLCFNLLKNNWPENKEEEMYLKVLQDHKILWKNTINLRLKELEKLQNLVEILKFIKNRIRHIRTMIKIAKKDKETLEKDENIKKLFSTKDSGFWPEKSFSRAFEKLVWEYWWNFNKLWDLTRLRIIWEDIDDVIEKVIEFITAINKIEDISHISISDKTWEPISVAKEKSWYRDIKILLKMKSWNTVEVQFQYKEMFEAKDKWIDFSKNKNIWKKMKDEWFLFKKEELKDLLEYSRIRNINLPKKEILENLTEEQNLNNINWEDYSKILKISKVSTDYTYHLIRQLEDSKTIKTKLTWLERILADSAWSKIVLKYLKSRGIKIE